MLLKCLASLGIGAQHSICFRRQAIERALDGVTLTVPVEEPLRFWYPLSPEAPIEDGRKPVDFDPPSAVLSGERLHQWIGARTPRGTPSSDRADLQRIRRQQILVRTLIDRGFDFARSLADPELVRVSDSVALLELGKVGTDWTYLTLNRMRPLFIDGMSVLALADDWGLIFRAYRQALWRALTKLTPRRRGQPSSAETCVGFLLSLGSPDRARPSSGTCSRLIPTWR
jgi:hypothetical protein